MEIAYKGKLGRTLPTPTLRVTTLRVRSILFTFCSVRTEICSLTHKTKVQANVQLYGPDPEKFKPLTFRTNCSAAPRISSSVTGGSKLKRVLMFLHISVTSMDRATRVTRRLLARRCGTRMLFRSIFTVNFCLKHIHRFLFSLQNIQYEGSNFCES